jgi:eukaryotic-like serine/threonine-protein kinase
MRSLFAEDTFESLDPNLAKLCEDKSTSKFSKRVKELLVAGSHGRMTDGMKEWGILGIYEIAAMAAMRGRCCPDAPALEVAGPPGTCAPLSTSLGAINVASHTGGSAMDLDTAVATFDKDVRCVIRAQQTQAFGDYGPLGGGEGTALEKTIQRIRPKPASY